MSEVTDPRYLGTFDAPPDGLAYRGPAMGHYGCDMWTNDESMFSPELRWALVRREEE